MINEPIANSLAKYNRSREEYDYFECLECNTPIANPICPECVVKEFVMWLDKFPRVRGKGETIRQIKNILRENEKFEGNSGKCIECGEHNTFMCPHCFIMEISKIIRANIKDRRVSEEFFRMFHNA